MSDNVSRFTSYVSHGDKRYSTTQLLTRPFDDQLKFDENGKIKDECKYTINNSTFNIQHSTFIGKPDDKFETMLFLPETEGRKGEGGFRTKGYFKHSYVRGETLDVRRESESESESESGWWISDLNNNPIQPAPPEIQQKINDYFASINSTFKIQHSTLNNPDTDNSTFNIQHSTLDNSDSDNSKFNIQHSTLDKLPLISIITVVFNGEKYLEETIQSVINQTFVIILNNEI